MSLSKEVLEGTREGVQAYLARGAPLNIIDEYGYTPLIHATVLNKLDIVELLLAYHAEPNIIDMTGSTALHWAVDNNNLAVCQRLLQAGADPNACTPHGQPVLFYPVLRKNKLLIECLIQKGADLRFAKDFVNAKLIGHRFELQGRIDLVNPHGLFTSINLEGFYLEFTLDLIQQSLERFLNSYVSHRMDLHEKEIQIIIQTLDRAVELRSFKHFSIDEKKYLPTIYGLLAKQPLLLPVSYKGHAITFIQYDNFFASCDRGVHKMTDPVIIHRITDPQALTNDFYTHLLYKRHTEHYIKHDITATLGLIPFAKLPIKHQITGNCSWANVEASIPTLLFMLLYRSPTPPDFIKSIMQFYRAWLEWDKDRALEDWLEDFNDLSFQQQQAKADLLGAVLFQACQPHRPHDISRAKRLLVILSKKEFRYIVKSYLDVFLKKSPSSQGLQFKELLKKSGYHLSDF